MVFYFFYEKDTNINLIYLKDKKFPIMNCARIAIVFLFFSFIEERLSLLVLKLQMGSFYQSRMIEERMEHCWNDDWPGKP
jgi:hypothetical protein